MRPLLYSASRFLARHIHGRDSALTKPEEDQINQGRLSEALKGWVMVLLTLIFVVLYGLALLGKLKPLSDVSMVSRLEPIIFVIIGYYFGRLPSQDNERTLKHEVDRQAKRANASQHALETALKTTEALEEKVKNALVAFGTGRLSQTDEFAENLETETLPAEKAHQRGSFDAGLKILRS